MKQLICSLSFVIFSLSAFGGFSRCTENEFPTSVEEPNKKELGPSEEEEAGGRGIKRKTKRDI